MTRVKRILAGWPSARLTWQPLRLSVPRHNSLERTLGIFLRQFIVADNELKVLVGLDHDG